MTRETIVGGVGVALASVLTAALAVPATAQQQSDPAASWEAVAACAQQDSADARHACIDGVLRRSGVLDPEREAEQMRQDFGRSEASNPAAPAQMQAPAVRSSTTAAPAAPAPIDTLVSTITDSRLDGRDRLRVLTAQGAIWQQIGGDRIRREPDPGTPFTVEQTALGGYRCKIGTGSVYRCERLD